MTPNRRGRPKADPLRDLRRDLLVMSRQVLEEEGPAALSMREVARRAGCTHQAPYHYFEDRETILATLVIEGFEDLTARLRKANELANKKGVRAALLASGKAYVDFALSQPGLFRIMFSPDVCNPQRFPQMMESGARARAELDRLNVIVFGKKAKASQATILWAHVHGLACLLVEGPLLPHTKSRAQQVAHLRDVAEQFADMTLAGCATPHGVK